MKGVVFTELLAAIEEDKGILYTERLLTNACPMSGGAYTSLGTYEHRELVSIVSAHCKEAGIDIADALVWFGKRLAKSFHQQYPDVFARYSGTITLLANVESEIHVEVRKLYSDAELPRLDVIEQSEHSIELRYRSSRAMAPLALGLVEGCATQYDERIEAQIERSNDAGTEAFIVARVLQ